MKKRAVRAIWSVVNCMKIWVLKSKSSGRLLQLKWRTRCWLKRVHSFFSLCNTLLLIPEERWKLWENHSYFFSPYVVTVPSAKGHFHGMIHLSNLHCRRIQIYTSFKILTPSCLSEGADLKRCPSLHVSSHTGCPLLNSVSVFSKLQFCTTLALLFCLTPSEMHRGFFSSPPARFSPGATGASLFPAAFHA